MYEKVKDNIYKIEVPLPNNPLKATNSYFIKGKDRNLLIDTGMNRKECLDALNKAIQSLGVDPKSIDVFVTHLHADHIGLAYHFAKDDSRIFFNYPDSEIVSDHTYWERALKRALENGFPEKEIEEAITKHPGNKYSPEKSDGFTFVKEDQIIEVGNYKLKCIETPGHTPGNTCLYEPNEQIFFSGDHVLWDITPNISGFLENINNPLKKYLESLNKIKELEVSLVLPGHRSTFENLELRVEQLKDHHYKRIDEIKSILEKLEYQTPYQIASKMTWDLDCKSWEKFPLMQKWFATGEALAHLDYMHEEGILKKEKIPEEKHSNESVFKNYYSL